MKRIILFLFSSLLFTDFYEAQTVYAQVSSKRVSLGTPFEYAIVISGNASNYSPPDLKDFDIVSGPNQSSSVQYVNGAMSQQLVISYGLLPRREGRFTIGPAVVNSGSQRYETSPVTVEVVKSGAQQSANAADKSSDGIGGADLFLRTTVSKSKCYIGEQIVIVQKVYSRHQIIGYQKTIPPAYDGFYSQALESPTKGQLMTEVVDGVNYYTHEIFRSLASPNKSGKITLLPPETVPIIRKPTQARPRNIFEQFFGAAAYEDIPVSVNGKPVTVEVLPLPEEGKPESFNGAVGNFTARIETSRQELKANEAFNLTITIAGKGNLKLLSPPRLTLPESFEAYEPRVTENGTSKTFDHLIIPRAEGQYTLSGLDFSFFNTDTKRYVTLPLGEIVMRVLPPDPGSAGAQVFHPQNQVKETENDIRYIKKGNFVLSKKDSEFFNSAGHIILITGIFLSLGAALSVRKAYIRKNSDLVLVKERKAAGIAKRQLREAEKLMKENRKDAFYAEILNALNNYLGHKLNIAAADLSHERISRVFSQKQVAPEVAGKFLETIHTCEYARYAPGAVSGDLPSVYNSTASLITTLEQQLNKRS